MNLMDKIVAVMVAGVLIGVGINQYMYDKDMDGVPEFIGPDSTIVVRTRS